MFASSKALVFGEDLSSDPVSKTLGFVLRTFSGGHVRLDVALFSQYLTLAFIGFISVTSLRGFLKSMQRFFRWVRLQGRGQWVERLAGRIRAAGGGGSTPRNSCFFHQQGGSTL